MYVGICLHRYVSVLCTYVCRCVCKCVYVQESMAVFANVWGGGEAGGRSESGPDTGFSPALAPSRPRHSDRWMGRGQPEGRELPRPEVGVCPAVQCCHRGRSRGGRSVSLRPLTLAWPMGTEEISHFVPCEPTAPFVVSLLLLSQEVLLFTLSHPLSLHVRVCH